MGLVMGLAEDGKEIGDPPLQFIAEGVSQPVVDGGPGFVSVGAWTHERGSFLVVGMIMLLRL